MIAEAQGVSVLPTRKPKSLYRLVGVPDAAGRAEGLCTVEVGTAAIDMLTAIYSDPCRTVRWCPIVIVFIAIFDPLPYVAVCIVEAERIGFFLAQRVPRSEILPF